jgi:N-acetylmuramoyl-L-alanine amidase
MLGLRARGVQLLVSAVAVGAVGAGLAYLDVGALAEPGARHAPWADHPGTTSRAAASSRAVARDGAKGCSGQRPSGDLAHDARGNRAQDHPDQDDPDQDDPDQDDPDQGNVGGTVPVAAAGDAAGGGLWVASTDGAVTPLGGAPFYGDARAWSLTAPVVGISATADGCGYWLLGSDGAVSSFGDAVPWGSAAGLVAEQPALQLVPVPGDNGYWIVTRDGRALPFGDARNYGSVRATAPGDPVVGMAATADGGGYWVATADGKVSAFGDAGQFTASRGPEGGARLVSIVGSPDGHGYWLFFADGQVSAAGSAARLPSPAGAPAVPALALVPAATGTGYWVVHTDGTVTAYGDAAPVAAKVPSEGEPALAGRVVTLDPGHNGRNWADPAYIDRLVNAGGFLKACNTTGTQTGTGYTEAAFNFDVAVRLAADLRRQGATVVMTRTSNDGVGPCIDQRAAIANQARSDVALSVHADGGPAWGRGFSVDVPQLDPGYNDGIIATSLTFGQDVVAALSEHTAMPVSDYTGTRGIVPRHDLGGLNLSKVPVALVECGNMANATDAGLQESSSFRQELADALDLAISGYLTGGAG